MNLPSLPGECAKLHLYPDPATGEIIRSYRRQTHHIMYRDHAGKFVLFSPPPKSLDTKVETPHATYLGQFASNLLPSFSKDQSNFPIRVQPVYQGLRLVSRQERRAMYREDRKRYKRARAKVYDKGEVTIDGQNL